MLGCSKKEEAKTSILPSSEAPSLSSTKGSIETKTKDNPKVDVPKPEFTLTADEYVADIEKDKQAAKAKYQGKLIELSGTVRAIQGGVPARETGIVNLGATNSMFGVNCSMTEKEPWARVSPGQQVRIRGKADTSGIPYLWNSMIVEQGPNPAVKISDADLAKEFVGDKKKTNQKYAAKYMIVEGEIVDKKEHDRYVSLFLRGDGNVRIECCVDPSDKDITSDLKPGRRIKMFGRYSAYPKEGDVVYLFPCLPITGAK